MLVQLSHLSALGYPKLGKNSAPPLPQEVVDLSQRGCTVLTFRRLAAGRPNLRIRKVSAVDRFLWVEGSDIVLYGLETDSPLAPLVMWDVAHILPVGGTITVMADHGSQSFLQRAYFSRCFDLVENTPRRRVLRKSQPLPAEKDKGLDAWTFGIPTGPEDATLLNETVRRILELDVPTKEILLCGRPGANFQYWNQVRIVGEDISAPPVKICAKKNRLAQEAAHPNLCIIHDRVFLPKDFHAAVKKFGDFFPLTTFQSVFFDDKFNFVPRRYSDAGITYKVKAAPNKGLMRDNDASNPSIFATGVLPMTEMYGFYAANIRRYSENMYPTGSLYLCKRSVWLEYPQNENLHWIEFEDLEHAFRAVDAGVPSRANPYTLTQSLIARPLLARTGGSFIESLAGVPRLKRVWTDPWLLPRKPAIKATHETALNNLQRFADKYVPASLSFNVSAGAVMRSRERVKEIVRILCRVQVPLSEAGIREFMRDFEKLVVMDQMPYSQIENLCHRLTMERTNLVKALIEENDTLFHQLASRPTKNMFCASLTEYLQANSPLLGLGTVISGLYLFLTRKSIIYLKGGPLAYIRALRLSTPFKRAQSVQ